MRRAPGTGTVVKIRNHYRARWGTDGKRIYGPKRNSRDEAELDRIKGPSTPSPEPSKPKYQIESDQMPFGDWAFECMKGGYGDGLESETFDTNEGHRLNHLNDTVLADLPIGLIRPSHIQTWVAGLRKMTWNPKEKKYTKSTEQMAPATVRRVYAMVSRAFSLAVRDGIIDVSPCRQIILPPIPDRKNRVLAPEESKVLLEPKNIIDVALVLGSHGFSRKEVILLEWRHVDFKGSLINVPGKKNVHRDRLIPMSAWLRRALEKLPRDTKRVIVNSKGEAYDPKALSSRTMARMRELGLPKETRFQDLRGTFITQALEIGVNIKTVMDMVGHSNPKTTLKAYARPRAKIAADAMANMEKAIMESKTPSLQEAER